MTQTVSEMLFSEKSKTESIPDPPRPTRPGYHRHDHSALVMSSHNIFGDFNILKIFEISIRDGFRGNYFLEGRRGASRTKMLEIWNVAGDHLFLIVVG